MLLRIKRNRDRLTRISPPRKIPLIRKAATLSRFDRVDGALDAIQKNALSVLFFDQRKASSILTKGGELGHKIVNAHVLELGDGLQIFLRQDHLPRPTAAVSTTLTLIENRIGIRGFRHIEVTANLTENQATRKRGIFQERIEVKPKKPGNSEGTFALAGTLRQTLGK